MELEAIPGVGEKTATALRELADPEQALTRGDVATIATAPGLSAGRAARIARNAIRYQYDERGSILQTEQATEIYDEIIELLQARTVTTYGARRIETFYPSRNRDRIRAVQETVKRALNRSVTESVRETLAGLTLPEAPADLRVRDRCVVTTDAEQYARAREEFPELSIETVANTRELADLARGYATVIALDESFAGVDIDGEVLVRPDALETPTEIVPERTLAWFATNRERLLTAIAVHRQADMEPPCELTQLERHLNRLDEDGTPTGDEQLDRLTAALDALETAVRQAERVGTGQLRDAIEQRDVTVEGSDLLSLVEEGAGVDSLLQRELQTEYEQAVTTARKELIEALQLTDDEQMLARRAFPEQPTFPLTHHEEPITQLRTTLQTKKQRRARTLKQTLANDLAAFRASAETLIRNALELDVELAIKRFSADYDCTLPELIDGGGAVDIAITDGRSPLLAVDRENIEPVEYTVDGTTVLSGVNSGGKTSLLDLIAVVVILAQMGLPVPAAQARVKVFEELHYHGKSQGTLDAGAFEATVREFAEIADGGAGSLVLVDELESITEPGASAKIIAGIVETLVETGTTAVIVSHLAAEIDATADIDVQIDGIEAQGLEDGELLVDRSPKKDHLARSTPELIVAKLAEAHEKPFYRRLLKKFDGTTETQASHGDD